MTAHEAPTPPQNPGSTEPSGEPATYVYRLRSTKYLLGEHQELKRQEIYFAKPEELNDPMEGYRDVIWQGDRIVWSNLFYHYISCLVQTLVEAIVVGDKFTVTKDTIPVRNPHGSHPPALAFTLTDHIYKRTFEQLNLDRLVTRLDTTQHAARRDEVLLYLTSIHQPALIETRAAFARHGLISTNPQLTRMPRFSSAHAAASSIIHQAHSVVMNEGTERLDAMCRLASRENDAQRTVLKYRARMSSSALAESSLDFVLDFPRTYLAALERIIYPDWYAACFLTDYHNSSVWGHYGDHHKGACLVFEAGGSRARPHLRLKQVVGSSWSRGQDGNSTDRLSWDYQPLPFYKVKYTLGIGELDFFRSIGTIPVHDLLSIWYTDKAGNRTNCSDHVGSKDEPSWRAKYWERFYRDITVKSKDWEYEGETRLILSSSLINLSDINLRKLKYAFSALREIIFGLNMDDEDRAEIFDIILKKCKETNRTDFKFYQAFYDHSTGKIAKTKIDVSFQSS